MSEHSKNVASINPHGSPSVTPASSAITENAINSPDTSPTKSRLVQQSEAMPGSGVVSGIPAPEAYRSNGPGNSPSGVQKGNPPAQGGGQQQPIRGSSVFNQKTNKNF